MKRRRHSAELLVALSLIYLCSVSTASAQENRALTVDDMLDLVNIDDVAMTPDGSRIFYSERRLSWEKNKYDKTFFMISSQGGDPTPFVRKNGGEQFRISPDGRYLSMLRKVDESPQIFLMPLDAEVCPGGRLGTGKASRIASTRALSS